MQFISIYVDNIGFNWILFKRFDDFHMHLTKIFLYYLQLLKFAIKHHF